MLSMTRRTAMKAMIGSLATFVIPAPRRRIDLMQFCSRHPKVQWSVQLPHCLEDWTYATDTRVCVRVRPVLGDVAQHTGKVPPFQSLSWNHDRLQGYRTLPKLDPLMVDGAECLACDGTGTEGGVPMVPCENCHGDGYAWTNDKMTNCERCTVCAGQAEILPAGVKQCPLCKGQGSGRFPSVVSLDGRYFDVKLYEKVRDLGAEYVHDNFNAMPGKSMLKFRFDGGDGLLMGIESFAVERRIVTHSDFAEAKFRG